MRRLTATLCLTIVVLLGSAGVSFALPQCRGSPTSSWVATVNWTDCFGTETLVGGIKYVGEFKDGNWHGQGTVTYADGSKYVGEWKYSKRHGQGTYTSADGTVKEGIWENSNFLYAAKPSPTPTIIAKKPSVTPTVIVKKPSVTSSPKVASSGLPACSGSYRSNCFGTLTLADGNKYVGGWSDGKKHGQGTFTYSYGAKYVGEFRKDERHGQGTWYYADGTVKKGIWENGGFKTANKTTPTVIAKKPSVTSSPKVASSGLPPCPGTYDKTTWTNCFGTRTYVGGSKYVGEWKDGQRHGQGTRNNYDRTKYVGEWENGIWHGRGTLTLADGSKYVGEWKYGRRYGQGAETFADGTVKKLIWSDDKFQYAKKPSVTPTVFAKKPSVTPEPAPAPKLVSSKQVSRSQELLQELGLYSGKLDGLAGSGTTNAIKEWQQRNELPKTGEVTKFQLVKLELEAIAHLRKTKSTPVAVASVKDIDPDKYAGIEFGKYHALVIGIDDYKHLPKLKTAVNDAEAVADVLKNNYGFDVNLLRNAKHSELIDALDDYESNLGVNDNLLIYYAGHGDLDKAGGEGYWHPADARKGKRGSWISNSSISTRLKALKARHVIVVADSCYSGNLLRSGDTSVDNRVKDVRRLNLKRSRGALTSGGLEPVVDSVGGNHSPFAKAFINALNDNKGVVDMSSMYPQIRKSVGLSTTKQTPEFSAVIDTNHEGGDFFFVRKFGVVDNAVQTKSAAKLVIPTTRVVDKEAMFWQSIQGSEDADDYQAYLTQYPVGSFVALAQVKVKKFGRTEVAKSSQVQPLILAPRSESTPAPFHSVNIVASQQTTLPSILPVGTSKQKYDYAFSLLLKRDFDSAEQAFRTFLQQHPEDERAGHAYYWLGETYYYGRKQYTDAAIIFSDGYKRFPEGAKAPDNLLKLAKSLAEIDEKVAACKTFAKLLEQFPNANTDILKHTKSELNRIGCN